MHSGYSTPWLTSLLDSVTNRGSGHTPSKSYPEYWNGGIKWVSLTDSDRLDCSDLRTTSKEISAAGVKNSSAVLHPAGTVIMSRDADVGKCAILATEMAVSQHFLAWECSKKGVLHNFYLYYWLQYHKAEFERIAVGSTIKTIGLPYFKKLKISYPPLGSQRRIADTLRTWDEAIEKVARFREAKSHAMAAARQRTFGLSGIPPAKWPSAKLSEITKRVRDRSDGGNQPVMTISGKSGFIRQDEKFDRFMAGESVNNYLLLKRGEFAYNKGNSKTYPQGCIYRLQQQSALVPFVYFAFALRDDLSSDFYAHLFEAGFLNHQLARLINSGVRNDGLLNIYPDDFFGCEVPVPPRPIQERAAEFFNLAKQEIAALDRELEALKRQKRGLMQKLLTGVLPVKADAEAAA